MHGTYGVDLMYPAASASFTVGYFAVTAFAAAIWALSCCCSVLVKGSCCTIPRTPCSEAATSAGVCAVLPPAPAPTSPGEAGVGAASSHGDFPVALPGMTRTWFADTTASLGGAVVDAT